MEIAIFLIIIFAGFIQGITSFGFSLIAVPLLSLILPLKEFVPMLIIYSLIMNSVLFFKLDGKVNKKRIIILVIVSTISSFIGVRILNVIDDNSLKLFVGIMIVFSSIIMMKGYRAKINNVIVADVFAGFLSGVLNGSVSLSGPPIVLLLSNEDTNKDTFRKTLTTYFLLLNILSLPAFFFGNLLTIDVLKLSAINILALFIGIFGGIRTSKRVKEKHFKKITLFLIFIMGLMSIISAII
ncbi:sulfite exporter TauE/SafE family protein [Helicovermis profundi]|uniref:Probable membrane transporter protein n=1 Tax=Helicovermis profundi TaxID=3065157 RepID=A0AAU9EUB5_9FIRM|nr:sulfite exporter TauE/SafE family protein [Clostridia bacterium S502]